jgi:Relaxase/Mobilisation nuclease domain/Large polyvalent protein-associated domain 7
VISKRIDRGKKTSNFDRLGRYVLEAKSDEAEILWTRTAEYVLDLKPETEGDKVLWFRISNCEADIPALAIAEVLSTQAENSRSQLDKTYHCVISFPEGEQPTQAQLEDIEDSMCKALGFGEHQRISAVHQDTDNIHLHLAINKIHPVTFKALEPYRDYYIRNRVCREMEQKHGLTIDNGIGQGQRFGKAREMEAHTGEQSLWSWIQTHAAEDLKKAAQEGESWQAVHNEFQKHGLTIKPRGAGLVIAIEDGTAAVKASSIDRSLSFKSLTVKLGPYEAPFQINVVQSEKNQTRYTPGPKEKDSQTQALYAEYQTSKQQAWQERNELKTRQMKDRQTFNAELKTWHQGERQSIQSSSMTTKQKREAYSQLAEQKRQAWGEQRQKDNAFKQKLKETKTSLSWEGFLVQSAEQGNSRALELLRSRRQRQERAATALLKADNYAAAKHVVYADLKPIARQTGEMLYHVQDGGTVTDERSRVRVDTLTAGSTFLALSMAAERFEGQPLDVQGNESFKKQVLQFAVQYQMPVQFKDNDMEAQRQRLVKEATIASRSQSDSPALKAFLAQRNQMREKVADVLPHRLWKADDAGEAVYQGRRNLADGSQVILLRRADEMLVKQLHEDFKQLKVGQVIQFNSQGQVASEQKGRSL